MRTIAERAARAGVVRAGALVVATGLILAGCGSDDESSSESQTPTASPQASAEAGPTQEPEPEGVQVDVEIADGTVTPQGERVEVTAGEPVTISVTSDESDEIHVHADPEVSIDVAPGESAEETFTIDTPGQAAVESHHLGVTIVQLVVRP